MGDKARVREVGLRDGLQMVREPLSIDRKLEWYRGEVDAGVPEIEITSYVPANVVPQFADAEEMSRRALLLGGDVVVSALVPNYKGAERALSCGVHTINFVLSASEDHNLANVRRTTADSIEDFSRIVALRNEKGHRQTKISGGIATAFGCTIAGNVPESRVLAIAEKLAELGADEIIVADTVGYGNPAQVHRILTAVGRIVRPLPIIAHFHDTRGLGLANVTAAVEAGIRRFDASLGGLGGCPFAPGATGNINTEDCVFLLEALGLDTGIDIERLVELRRTVETWLPRERFSGAIARAGLPKTFQRRPHP